MSSNKSVKQKLIELYGAECFIDKLHLRPIEDGPKHYTSKGQMKKMKQLTYHHIIEKSKGGRTTIENGALLSLENHEWFNKQSREYQAEMNKKFQEYKKCNISLVDAIDIPFRILSTEIVVNQKGKIYNRAKEKQEMRRIIEEEIR